MLRRILHLPRLHGPFPRHQLQNPYGTHSSNLNFASLLCFPLATSASTFALLVQGLRSENLQFVLPEHG
jgi:hypothetical protein